MSKRGPLNLSAHIEIGIASILAREALNRGVKGVSVRDFLHYWKPTPDDEDEGYATLADVMGILTGAMTNGK